MEQLVHAGLVKWIRVSDFNQGQVERISQSCKIKAAGHAFESHPYLQQNSWVKWNREHGIQVIADSPLGNMNSSYPNTSSKVLDDN